MYEFMKKILFTCYFGSPNPNSGGPNKIILEIIKNLKPNNFKAGYFSSHYRNFEITKEDIKNMIRSKTGPANTLRIKMFNQYKLYRRLVLNRWYWNFNFLKSSSKFKKNLNEFCKFDIIHSHDVISFYYISRLKSKKILTIHSKPLRDDVRDQIPDKGLFSKQITKLNKIEVESFKNADIVTFPSYAAKNLFLSLNNLNDSSKIHVVYNGIDTSEIDSVDPESPLINKILTGSETDLYILNVSEHIKTKRIDKCLSVIRDLVYIQRMNPLFVNVGKGPETNQLNNLIEEYNIRNNVLFIPHLNHLDVIRLMKRFDIYLSLSERVIFDLVILEAMACGMVVIASNDGGNKEIINNRNNGYLVNNKSESIKTILNFDINIRQNAKTSIKQFRIEKMIEQYKTLYLYEQDN